MPRVLTPLNLKDFTADTYPAIERDANLLIETVSLMTSFCVATATYTRGNVTPFVLETVTWELVDLP